MRYHGYLERPSGDAIPVTAPIVPDFREVFERCFELREAQEAADGWHTTRFDENGVPYVHASSTGGCPREYVLRAAGAHVDPNTVDSMTNFALGNALHKVLEDHLTSLPEFDGWKCLFSERGLTHSQMNLVGKADAILQSPGGDIVLFDLKSEAAQGKTLRERDNPLDHVRPEHKLQIAAGALLAEDAGIVEGRIETGMVCYISRLLGKNSWSYEAIAFAITDELRANVVHNVTDRVNAWNNYKATGTLPSRLAPIRMYGKMMPDWKCKQRGPDDERGMYCQLRAVCFAHEDKL